MCTGIVAMGAVNNFVSLLSLSLVSFFKLCLLPLTLGPRNTTDRIQLSPGDGEPQLPRLRDPKVALRPRDLPHGSDRRDRQHLPVSLPEPNLHLRRHLERRVLFRRHHHHPGLQRPQTIRQLRVQGLSEPDGVLFGGDGRHDWSFADLVWNVLL